MPANGSTNGHGHGGQDNHAYEAEESLQYKPSRNGTSVDPKEEPAVVVEMEEDPWKVDMIAKNYVPWEELTTKQKVLRSVLYPLKIAVALGVLYLFICSLDFLSSAFKLIGGKKAGEVFKQNDILTNPVAGLMMGGLVTGLVQSSSTSTSIIISMVGAQILTVKTSVPIIMGANIGTSVTNTLVALGQITQANEFRRAFAGATVHDMFNWLTVLVLLPLEIITGYLNRFSGFLVDSLHITESKEIDFLKVITKPFTELIIQVSSSGITKIAKGEVEAKDTTLMKTCCDEVKPDACCSDRLDDLPTSGVVHNFTDVERSDVCAAVRSCVNTNVNMTACVTKPWSTGYHDIVHSSLNTLNCTALAGTEDQTKCCMTTAKSYPAFSNLYANLTQTQQQEICQNVNTCFGGSGVSRTCANSSSWITGRVSQSYGDVFSCKAWTKLETTCNEPCHYLFKYTHKVAGGHLGDEELGGILLFLSLLLLCLCLFCLVKLLHSLLQGPMAVVIKKFVNYNFPGRASYFTGYLALLLGAGLTIIVQSSSIFTSTLTPLVGIGVIDLDRMYPLTLGSNIGTTFTGIMAALAGDRESIPRALQVAFCHLFFNVSGILIFYPFPFFRPPIPAAKFLGNTTAKYRWFSIVYLLVMFFILPAAVFGLSVLGWYVLLGVMGPIALVFILVAILKLFQHKCSRVLPHKLKTFKFLPKFLRSLEPYDRVMKYICFCRRFQGSQTDGASNQRSTPIVESSAKDVKMEPVKARTVTNGVEKGEGKGSYTNGDVSNGDVSNTRL